MAKSKQSPASGVSSARRAPPPDLDKLPVAWRRADDAPFRLSGFAWHRQEGLFRRLPAKPAEPLRPPVDGLANHTAGGQIGFMTDSRIVKLNAELAGPADMHHMAATGACGFDIYLGPPRSQRFYGVTRFGLAQSAYDVFLFRDHRAAWRSFTINFPLYQGVRKLRIGLERTARVKPPAPFALSRPVVIYGTSITQGGCASRPGMAYSNILSRRLNAEIINLGFSGNGQAEPEVARLIAAIPDPALLVIDCEANCGNGLLEARLPDFIGILRAAHPTPPILLVSRILFAADLAHRPWELGRRKLERFQRRLVERARRRGDRRMFFLSGKALLGADPDECTVDGVHATDLGFYRMAGALEPVIRKLVFKT